MSLADLLHGWTAVRPSAPVGPVADAASALEQLGARSVVETWDPHQLRVVAPTGRTSTATLDGWTGEWALRARLEELGEPSLVPAGGVLCAYAGLRLAGAVLAGGRRRHNVGRLVEELLAGRAARGRIRPELLRCDDGWVVARFRDDGERELLQAMAGPLDEAPVDGVVAEARLAQLLVAAVRPPGPAARPAIHWQGTLDGARSRPGPRPRVVDWTVLWAGPWATAELRRGGAEVLRLEHPRRRDGLLNSPGGAAWWKTLNGRKALTLLDARDPRDHGRVARELERADIAITSMTPRSLASLGFDDAWRAERAPQLLHIEIVAFDEPSADIPGLGEQAAAEAGLLWRDGGEPAAPYSWPDPLVGAAALLVSGAWLASGRRRGGRVRLTLERAATTAAAAR